MAKIHNDIVKLLESSGKPLTLAEIAEKLEKSEKKVYNALKKLFSDGKINCDGRTREYSLAKK